MNSLQILNAQRRSFPVIFRLLGLSVFFIVSFINVLPAQPYARKPERHFGVSAGSGLSANRFGTVYSPSVFYMSGRHLYSAGLTLQKGRTDVTGVRGNYEFTLLDGNTDEVNISWLELFVFANASYYSNASFGKSLCEEELAGNPELRTDLHQLRLKAIDSYTGFGLRVDFLKNFKWFGCIGIGAYNVLNAPADLYYSSHGAGLLYRTGISWQFAAAHKTSF